MKFNVNIIFELNNNYSFLFNRKIIRYSVAQILYTVLIEIDVCSLNLYL